MSVFPTFQNPPDHRGRVKCRCSPRPVHLRGGGGLLRSV
uniref:Uncharacterized protein n=1 Tax=Anguilla anguilla TaxID=7936 RepID=A0A0E9U669_ANGAN